MSKIKNDSIINASDNKLVLYTDKRGDIELRADVEKDTLWATQAQISSLFEVNIPTVNEHLKNIFTTKELREVSVIRKFRITAKDGKQYLTKLYNLDAIIAVGYRVNSKKATKFRIWATKILHQYLVKGFNVSERTISRSSDNVEDLQKALAFMGSDNLSGALKGKMVLRVSKEMKG
jgi:hypothetical protein